MTRGAKIGCLVFAGALLLLAAAVIGGAVYVGRDVAEGARLSNLGYDSIRRRQYDQAITNLTAATKHILIGENRYWVYMHRASAERYRKQNDAAIQDLNEAIRAKPDSA